MPISFGAVTEKQINTRKQNLQEKDMDFTEAIQKAEYGFLRDPSKIRGRLCYLTVSGSYAYGTNNDNSDLDIRGIAVENHEDLLLGKGMEQYEDTTTDTVVYGLQKYVSICRGCNPNALEMLGTRPDHVLFMDAAGKLLRDNIELFLSKKAYQTFAGYATSQLRRIQNAMAHDSYPEAEKERHIKRSIENMMLFVKEEYSVHEGTFDFGIEDAETNPHLVVSVHVEDMPLRKFNDVNSHIHTMLRNYDKLNHRNRKKDEAHLRKHAMHLVRLYLTGIDILRGNGVQTYREKELSLLRDIRAGKTSMEEVFKLAEGFEEEIKDAYAHSKLPAMPDNKAIDNLLLRIYRERV